MKPRRYLDARSPFDSVLPFMLNTADGVLTLAIMTIYVLWGVLGLLHPLPTDSIAEPSRLLAAAALMPLFYLKNRYGTYSDDREQGLVSALCTMFFACTPFYHLIDRQF